MLTWKVEIECGGRIENQTTEGDQHQRFDQNDSLVDGANNFRALFKAFQGLPRPSKLVVDFQVLPLHKTLEVDFQDLFQETDQLEVLLHNLGLEINVQEPMLTEISTWIGQL